MSTYVSYTTGSTSGGTTSVTFNTPASVQNGDLLILGFIIGSSTGTISLAGWTELTSVVSGSNKAFLLYKIASSEPASYTFTITSNNCSGIMSAWRGVNNSTPFATSGSAAGSTTTVSGATLTSTAANQMNVWYGFCHTGQAETINVPAALTKAGQYYGGAASAKRFTGMGYGTKASAATIGATERDGSLGTATPAPNAGINLFLADAAAAATFVNHSLLLSM
jgi:hypothetical protein